MCHKFWALSYFWDIREVHPRTLRHTHRTVRQEVDWPADWPDGLTVMMMVTAGTTVALAAAALAKGPTQKATYELPARQWSTHVMFHLNSSNEQTLRQCLEIKNYQYSITSSIRSWTTNSCKIEYFIEFIWRYTQELYIF